MNQYERELVAQNRILTSDRDSARKERDEVDKAFRTQVRYLDAANTRIADLEAQLAAATAKLHKWNTLVASGCTPGGSEFHDDPERTAMFIRTCHDDLEKRWRTYARERNAANARAEAAELALADAREQAASYDENKRWQDAIDEVVYAEDPDRDGSGCDSGDPLDLTLAEIRGAFNVWHDRLHDQGLRLIGTGRTAKIATNANHVLTDDGVTRKHLTGTRGPAFHTTKDGAIVADFSASVWSFERKNGTAFTGQIIRMDYGTWYNVRWDDDLLPVLWNRNAPDGEWACYSTLEAAEAARKDTP